MGLLLATIGVVALWSERTLGSPTVNPYSEYSRLNMPFDRMGFGVDPTPPIRRFPADLQGVFDQWRRIHAEHTWPRLPTIAAYRALTLLQQLGGGWRRGLLVLFVAGIGISTTLEGLLIWSVACMFLGYLAFAHPSAWTVYYVEIFPAVFLLAVAQDRRLGMKGEPDPNRKRARGDALLAVSLAVVLPLMWADVGRCQGDAPGVPELPSPCRIAIRGDPGEPGAGLRSTGSASRSQPESHQRSRERVFRPAVGRSVHRR